VIESEESERRVTKRYTTRSNLEKLYDKQNYSGYYEKRKHKTATLISGAVTRMGIRIRHASE